jgi:hypothetical protein
MDAGTLYDAIAEVSPVISTSVGKEDDRSTWTWIPGTNATQPQIDAGNNVIATIPIEILSVVSASEFVGRFTNAEWRAVDAAAWRQTAGHAKNLDTVLFSGTIDMNLKRTKTLKDELVAGGILTAARADEIFS